MLPLCKNQSICISNQLPQFYISENLIFNGLSKKLVGKRFLFNFPHLLLPFVNFSFYSICFKALRFPLGSKDRSICFHPMQRVSRFYCCTGFFLFKLIKFFSWTSFCMAKKELGLTFLKAVGSIVESVVKRF